MENKEKEVYITIPDDPLNKGYEQFKVYRRDTQTVRVPVGMANVKVPLWVAEIAVQAGDITSYFDPTKIN